MVRNVTLIAEDPRFVLAFNYLFFSPFQLISGSAQDMNYRSFSVKVLSNLQSDARSTARYHENPS
jgi:hypothetical protein